LVDNVDLTLRVRIHLAERDVDALPAIPAIRTTWLSINTRYFGCPLYPQNYRYNIVQPCTEESIAMATAKTERRTKKAAPTMNGVAANDVLTLPEAAAYLRLSEDEVVRQMQQQGLPGRQVEDGWRFLKSALRHWLCAPRRAAGNQNFWETQLGAFKDDSNLQQMVDEIYQERGRSVTDKA
jgi:hypothetical protein